MTRVVFRLGCFLLAASALIAQEAEPAVRGYAQLKADQSGAPTVAVRSLAPGTVTKIYARPGQQIKYGEILSELDYDQQLYQRDTSKAQAEAEGGMQSAEGQLAQRKADLEEMKELLRRRQVAEYRVVSAEAWVQWAEGQLKAIREQKEQQKITYEYWSNEYEKRFIRSPLDGVVAEVKVTEGQGIGVAAHVYTITNTNATQLTAVMTADQLGNVGVKDRVLVRQPGSKKLVPAVVQEIVEDPADKTKKTVRLLFDNRLAGEAIKPGQFDLFLPSIPSNGAKEVVPPPAAPTPTPP